MLNLQIFLLCNMKLAEVDISKFDTLLLDRDGTINVHIVDGYVQSWDDFEFIPGVFEALKNFSEHFKHIFVVTNQRGVGKGIFSEQELRAIHEKMCDKIAANGGRIDKIYYCTALSESDVRRKPGRGMFDDIIHDYPDITPSKCLMLGDGNVDMEFAKNSGIVGVKIDSLKKKGSRYYWEKSNMGLHV